MITTSKDGTKIAYSKTGNGPALVSVDGAFCYRENGPAKSLEAELKDSFTVYTYDRRGRGESGDTKPYSVDREIEDLQAVIDAAGGSVYVFGVSSGAILALKAATKLTFKKLVLFEAPFVADAGVRPPEDALQQLEKMVHENRRAAAVKYYLSKVVHAPAFFVGLMPFIMAKAWKRNLSVANTLPYDLQVVGDLSLAKEAGKVATPTLVIGGTKSPVWLQNGVKQTAEAIPGAKLVMLPTSHMLKVSSIKQSLLDFLA